MKLDKAIEDVQEAEAELAKRLRSVGERHAVEADLYHMSHTLARRSAGHLETLRPFAQRYGASAADDDVDKSPGVLETMRHKSANLLGRSELSGLLLLRDLRELYLTAQNAEIAWVVLVQSARAIRDGELHEVADTCREEAEVRWKWVRTRIKETAPQVIAAG